MKKTILVALLSSSVFSIQAMAQNADRIADSALLKQEPAHSVMQSTTGGEITLDRSVDKEGVVTTVIHDVNTPSSKVATPSTHTEIQSIQQFQVGQEKVALTHQRVTSDSSFANPVVTTVNGVAVSNATLSHDVIAVKVDVLKTPKHHFFSFFEPKRQEETHQFMATGLSGASLVGGISDQTDYVKSVSTNEARKDEAIIDVGQVNTGFHYVLTPVFNENQKSVLLNYNFDWSTLDSMQNFVGSNGLSIQKPNTHGSQFEGAREIKLDTPTTLLGYGGYDLVVTVHHVE